MAVGAIGRSRAAFRAPTLASAAPARPAAAGQIAAAEDPAQAPPQPGPDGVVRSEAAKEGYKAWLKGRVKAMFEDIIATATKRRS